MKSIKTKMSVVVCLLVAVSLTLVGGAVSVLMYASSMTSLEKTLIETAKVSAELVYESLNTYKAAATEAGMVARLSNPELSVAEKQSILTERVKLNNFLAGNLFDRTGQGITTDSNIASQEFFQRALKGESTISNVIHNPLLDKYTVSIFAPVWQEGRYGTQVYGVLSFSLDALMLSDITNQIQVGDSGSAYLLDADNFTIAHQNPALVTGRDNTLEGVKNDPQLEQLAALEAEMTAGKTGFGTYHYGGANKILAYAPVPTGQGWSLAVNAELDEFLSGTYLAIGITLGLVLVSIVVGVFVSLRLATSIAKPLIQIKNAAGEMSKGNFDVTVDYQSKDEVGMLAASMREMIHSTKEIIFDASRGLSEFAAGNFDVTPQVEYVGVFRDIEDSMKQIIIQMSDTMRQIQVASDQVSSGSGQVADGAQALAQGATEQASAIEELSASINEISNQITNNAEHAETANSMAGVVGNKITISNEQMSQMMTAIQEISASSQQISKIIKTIDDIAFQTNILALNAAVEAARAGAAGKGFAVVADEVRNLAGKSAEAAKQTNALIEGSVRSVQNGVNIAAATAKSLSEVVTGAVEITELIQQISQSSSEQSTSILQINQGVEQISNVVQTNSATSEQSAAASEELSGQASLMKSLVGRFRLKGQAEVDLSQFR